MSTKYKTGLFVRLLRDLHKPNDVKGTVYEVSCAGFTGLYDTITLKNGNRFYVPSIEKVTYSFEDGMDHIKKLTPSEYSEKLKQTAFGSDFEVLSLADSLKEMCKDEDED